MTSPKSDPRPTPLWREAEGKGKGKDAERCAGQVWAGDGWRPHRCERRGVVKEDGQRWCRTHAPSIEKQRREKNLAASRARWEAQAEADQRRNLRRGIGKMLMDAAKLAVQHFERNKASGNFQGDDEHEAWTALSKAIAKAEER